MTSRIALNSRGNRIYGERKVKRVRKPETVHYGVGYEVKCRTRNLFPTSTTNMEDVTCKTCNGATTKSGKRTGNSPQI